MSLLHVSGQKLNAFGKDYCDARIRVLSMMSDTNLPVRSRIMAGTRFLFHMENLGVLTSHEVSVLLDIASLCFPSIPFGSGYPEIGDNDSDTGIFGSGDDAENIRSTMSFVFMGVFSLCIDDEHAAVLGMQDIGVTFDYPEESDNGIEFLKNTMDLMTRVYGLALKKRLDTMDSIIAPFALSDAGMPVEPDADKQNIFDAHGNTTVLDSRAMALFIDSMRTNTPEVEFFVVSGILETVLRDDFPEDGILESLGKYMNAWVQLVFSQSLQNSRCTD